MSETSGEFRLLAAGQALSWLGDGFQTVALAVAIVLTGGGPGDLGLVMATSVLAMLAGTLFGGVWADRLQPQRVMVASDLVRGASVAGMAVMFGTGHRWLLLLCALQATTSLAGSFFSPAMASLRPLLVTAEQRQAANALLGLLRNTCAVLGPAAGGLVVAVFGAATGFAVNATSFLASVGTVVLIKARAPRQARGGMLHELREGWAAVRSRDWLLAGVLAATVYHVANGAVLVLAQVVVVRDLGGAGAAGAVAAAEGLGGVVGAAIALRVRPVRLLRGGWLALLLMPVWALSYVWPGALAAVIVGAALGYAGLSFFSIAWDTAIQDHVPHHLLARVVSWDILTSFIAMPLGSLLAGPLSRALGIDRVLVACAAVLLGASAAPLFVPGTRSLIRPAADVGTPEPATARP